MYFAKHSVTFALCLLGAEAATYSQTFCQTKVGTKSVANVPESTKTITVPLVVFRKTTSTPTTTIVPPSITLTATATSTVTTSTVQPANNVVATTTDTVSSTTTTTSVQTQSATVTTTTTITTAGTVTISAAPGFTAIQDEPGYVARRGVAADPEARREAHGFAVRAGAGWTRATQNNVLQLKKGSKQPVSPRQYPQSVQCLVIVEPVSTRVATLTAKTTATKTQAPGTVSQTITVATTTTSTIYPPDVTSTVTESTTLTVTVQTTSVTMVTTTSTATVAVPDPASPTIYAACQPNNFASSANGGGGINSIFIPNNYVSVSGSDYDVCVQCQNTPNCNGFLAGGDNYLLISADNTCAAGTFQGQEFQTCSSFPAQYGFVVGNGPCGLWRNGGATDC